MEEFLADSHNRLDLLASFFAAPNEYPLAVKIPCPIDGTLGYLLDQHQAEEFKELKMELTQKLRECMPSDSFYELERWKMGLVKCGIPYLLLQRFESFLSRGEERLTLTLDAVEK